MLNDLEQALINERCLVNYVPPTQIYILPPTTCTEHTLEYSTIVIFYNENTVKVVLCCIFLSGTSEKIYNSTFPTVYNIIFQMRCMEKYPRTYTVLKMAEYLLCIAHFQICIFTDCIQEN